MGSDSVYKTPVRCGETAVCTWVRWAGPHTREVRPAARAHTQTSIRSAPLGRSGLGSAFAAGPRTIPLRVIAAERPFVRFAFLDPSSGVGAFATPAHRRRPCDGPPAGITQHSGAVAPWSRCSPMSTGHGAGAITDNDRPAASSAAHRLPALTNFADRRRDREDRNRPSAARRPP
jgi:hypothetical protein